jgi:cadmium resistance protein CadD (predicted permease)
VADLMREFELLGVAIVLFASTNLDDVFVLVGFFADPKYRPRDIVTGQYAGITTLFVVSLVGSLLALVISPAYIGLLGIVAIGLGVKKLFDLSRNKKEKRPKGSGRHMRATTIALVTLTSGADNISLYMPAFAGRSGYEISIFRGSVCLYDRSVVPYRTEDRPATHSRCAVSAIRTLCVAASSNRNRIGDLVRVG